MIVRDDQLVRLVAVLEVVVQPFFFHQPAGKGQVALLVLHAILARRILIALLQLELEVRAERLQHALQYVEHRQLLEDARLHPFAEQPQSRHQHGAIVEVRAVVADTLEPADDAVEEGRAAVCLPDAHRGGLPQHLVESRNARPRTLQLQLETIQLREGRYSRKTPQQQRIRSQRRIDRERPILQSLEHLAAP
jgi:hypothetical protein